MNVHKHGANDAMGKYLPKLSGGVCGWGKRGENTRRRRQWWPFHQQRYYHLISCVNFSLKRLKKEKKATSPWITRKSIFTHVNFYSPISPPVPSSQLDFFLILFFPPFKHKLANERTNEREMRRRRKIRKAAINHNFLTISSFFHNFLRCTIFFHRKNSFFDALPQTDFCRKRKIKRS